MVIMDDNKQDPKEFVDKLYKKLIRIHVEYMRRCFTKLEK